MGVEVERKFLVADDSWRDSVTSATRIVQGYIAQTEVATVRVRVRADTGYLTIKGATVGVARSEYEYPIPVDDALAMLAELANGPVIDKVRHLVPVGSHVWEVDVFSGANAPLVMAEVELSGAEEAFVLPGWAGTEVSQDMRYFNVNLAREPYATWGHA